MTETTNYGLMKMLRGETGWHVGMNQNMDTIDAALEDLSSGLDEVAEVYIASGNTFNGTTGVAVSLPKAVSATNEYSCVALPTTRAGAIGDIYFTKGTSDVTVHCSEANTTDTFELIVLYKGDSSAYGYTMFREWIASPATSITDHGDVSVQGSLAWISDQAGSDEVNIRLPGNHVYQLKQNFTLPSTQTLCPDRGAMLDLNYSIREASYQWTESGSGTSEYYLEAAGGGDPGIEEPASVIEDNMGRANGTAGSLAAGEWDWADNDTLGFNTVYIRLSDSSDPDGKASGYVEAEYALTIEGGFAPVDELAQCFIADADTVTLNGNTTPHTRPEWWDADEAASIQRAINCAVKSYIYPIKLVNREYVAEKLYGHYDAANNPGYPSDEYRTGRFKLSGAGCVDVEAVNNSVYYGTRIRSTDATGPLLYVNGDLAGGGTLKHQKNTLLENLTLEATNTDCVLRYEMGGDFCGTTRVMILQHGGGGGVDIVGSSYLSGFENSWIYQTNTGSGIGYKLECNERGAGAIYRLNAVTIKGFATNIQAGTIPYSAGASADALAEIIMDGCQASTGTVGIVLGEGISSVHMRGTHFESNGLGLSLRSNVARVTTASSWFLANTLDVEIGTGVAAEDRATQLRFDQCYFQRTDANHAVRIHAASTINGIIFSQCSFYSSVSSDHAIELDDARYYNLRIEQCKGQNYTQLVADSTDADMSHRCSYFSDISTTTNPKTIWSSEQAASMTQPPYHFLQGSQTGGQATVRISQADADQPNVEYVNRTLLGTLKLWTYQNDALVDDDHLPLPTATDGMVFVSCGAEAGMWLVQADGTTTKIAGSANTATGWTDGNLVVYGSGGQASIGNRLGTTEEVRAFYYYN